MKKITIIVLCACIAVSATACSQHNNTASELSLSVSSVSEPTSEKTDRNDNESIANFSSEYFAEIIKKPDTIICYANGEEKTIELAQQTDEIFELSQVALSERTGQYGLAYEESDVKNAKEKGIVLEFLYDNPIYAEWKYSPDFSVNYEYSCVTIVVNGGDSSLGKMVLVGSGTPTPIGDFIASDDLMRIIRDIAPESPRSSTSSEAFLSSSSQSEALQQQSSISSEASLSSSSQSEVSQQQSSASTNEQPESEWNGYYDWVSYDNLEYARFGWSYEQSELGESLGKVTAYGLDSLNSIIYKTTFEAFAIKDVLPKEGIAVRVKINGETWYAPFFAQEQSFITGKRFSDFVEEWQ